MLNSDEPFDLIVVGGGIAGLTTAVRAAEIGLRPLLLEKGTGVEYPNNSRFSGGIVHIGFHDPYRPPKELEDLIHKLTSGEAKPELAAALAKNGARLISWLQDKGGKFMRFNPQEGYRWCMAPPRALRAGIDWKERGPDLMLKRLVLALVELGGKIQYGARATNLMMQDGKCIGVRGLCDGQETRWNAPHVVIADGGFQTNHELYEKYIGSHFSSMFQRGGRTGYGDGINMVLEVGGVVNASGNRFYGHILCSDAKHNDAVWPYPELDAIATAGLVIDANGRRIVDEGRSGVHLANELAAKATTEKLFAIFDHNIWNGPGTSARIPANPLLERAGGTILRATSFEELAHMMSVPSEMLNQTVTEYNLALASGSLEDLHIKRSNLVKPWPINPSQIMAIPICPGITYTMAGIDIDQYAQVLDQTSKPIPGVFAAGATTGGLEGGSDSVYIGGLIKSGSFGLIAAERIAHLQGKTVNIQFPKRIGDDTSSLDKTSETNKNASYGLERFPVLRSLIRFGKPIAILLGLLAAIITFSLLPASLGWLSSLIALGIGGFFLVIILGVVELIVLITEFLIPDQ
jgi:fumarate reductase flavoprotein subunit